MAFIKSFWFRSMNLFPGTPSYVLYPIFFFFFSIPEAPSTQVSLSEAAKEASVRPETWYKEVPNVGTWRLHGSMSFPSSDLPLSSQGEKKLS